MGNARSVVAEPKHVVLNDFDDEPHFDDSPFGDAGMSVHSTEDGDEVVLFRAKTGKGCAWLLARCCCGGAKTGRGALSGSDDSDLPEEEGMRVVESMSSSD